MKMIFNNIRGFTLLEIIVSIVVIVIIGVVAGVGLVEISKGYVFSKKKCPHNTARSDSHGKAKKRVQQY